jgi:two-component system, LuxR family, sensor kinase FixL
MRDSRPGLTAEAADRLFEAFYTPKRDGMGMGLAISRSIIEAPGLRICLGLAEVNNAEDSIQIRATSQTEW